jgi:hypothetical protein
MQILQRTQQLPGDEAVVHVHEDVRADNSVQVSVHQLKDEVNVAIIRRPMHRQQRDQIRVAAKLAKEADLPVRWLGVRSVLECIVRLLDGNNAARLLVERLPNNTVGALPDFLKDLVAAGDLAIEKVDVLVLLRHLAVKFAIRVSMLTYSVITSNWSPGRHAKQQVCMSAD